MGFRDTADTLPGVTVEQPADNEASTYLRSPDVLGGGVGAPLPRPTIAGAEIEAHTDGGAGVSELHLRSTGGGTFENPDDPAHTISWFQGDLTVPGEVIATDSVYSQAYAGTTDANGWLVVNHAAGFTPTGGWAATGNPNSSFAQFWGIDSLGPTSVRLRFTSTAVAGPLASTAVAGRLFLVRP